MLLALLMGFVAPMTASAQSDGFFRGGNDNYQNRDSEIPITGSGIQNDDFGAPLGSGLLILTVVGAGYAISRRRKSYKTHETHKSYNHSAALFLAIVMLLGMTNCKKKQAEPQNVVVNQVMITLDAGGNGGSKHTINTTTGAVTFQDGDVIYVGDGNHYIGKLTREDGVFSGNINQPANNTEIYFYFVGGLTPSATPSAGSTSSFTVDISNQSTKMPVLSSNHTTYHEGTTSYSCKLQNKCALVKFTTASTSAAVRVGGLYTKATINFATSSITPEGTTGFVTLNSGSETEKWAVLLPQASFIAEAAVAQQGYTVTVPAIAADDFITGESAINISTTTHNIYLDYLTSEYTAQNGDVLKGCNYSGGYKKVSIADNATITLDNVNIVSTSSPFCAGLTCLGNATIILADGTTNKVTGYGSFDGITISQYYKTLTIQGTGSLEAYGGSSGGCGIGGGKVRIEGGIITATAGANSGSAGIGLKAGSNNTSATITITGGTVTAVGKGAGAGIGTGGLSLNQGYIGNITISGGNVTAIGGTYGAGIGCGRYGICSNITIEGGTVNATGGQNAAGIGSAEGSSSYQSNCTGTISITDGVTSVTATKGEGASNSIGVGYSSYSKCTMVTIGGTEYWKSNAYQNDGATYLTQSPLVYPTPGSSIPEGAINGRFTINSDNDQVYFSRGNLQAIGTTTSSPSGGWTWTFATNQWDYIGNSAANTRINGNGTISNAGTVDLFGYSTGNTYYGINNSTSNNDYDGDFVDWGGLIGTGWRTLTGDEWAYVFNTRASGSTVNSTDNARYTFATINTDGTSVYGLVLFPDDVTIVTDEATSWGNVNTPSDSWSNSTQCTTAQWNALATKGCVFLPFAGYRSGTTVTINSRGDYRSSTPDGSTASYSYYVRFYEGHLEPKRSYYRSSGYSVRLVYDAN